MKEVHVNNGPPPEIILMKQMSRSMTKPTKWRLLPANNQNVQADLSHRWAHMSFCWFCRASAQIKDEDPTEKWHWSTRGKIPQVQPRRAHKDRTNYATTKERGLKLNTTLWLAAIAARNTVGNLIILRIMLITNYIQFVSYTFITNDHLSELIWKTIYQFLIMIISRHKMIKI